MGSRAKRVMGDTSNLTPYEKVNRWFDIAAESEYNGHDSDLFKMLTLESVTFDPTPSNPHNSSTVFSLVVPHSLCNMSGSLHGGAVALIFDICTSTAISPCSKEGFWDQGNVSRTLNCTYLRPALEGQKIWIESSVVHLGKKMGVMRGEIKNEEGKVCYLCEHGKAAVGSSNL